MDFLDSSYPQKSYQIRIWVRLQSIVLGALFFGLMGSAPNAFGGIHYIRAGATGSNSGNDWSNAYPSFPTTMIRGDTYYVAAGSYGAYTFDTAPSGTSLITIKKATAADHGTSTGWSSGYGTGVANLGVFRFETGYWVIDGSTGGGPGSWNSGYGFSIFSTAGGVHLCFLAGNINNVNLRHIKFASSRDISPHIAGIKGTTGSCSNITISYCALTEIFANPFHMNNWTNFVIEYCYIYWNKSTPDAHGEGISSIGYNNNGTIRWNLWDKIEGTAIIAGVNLGTSDNWKIYGNIFSRSVTPIKYVWQDPGTNRNEFKNAKVFNNTIVTSANVSQGSWYVERGANNLFYNNLFYKNQANQFTQAATHNWTFASGNIRTDGGVVDKDSELLNGEANGQNSSSSPFVSYNSEPLQANLAAQTNAGLNTHSILPDNDRDMFGNLRSGWDRGAIEHNSGGPTPSPTPTPTPTPPNPTPTPTPPNPTPTPTPTATPTPAFGAIGIGARIKVNITPSLRVRSTPNLSGTVLGEQVYLARGTVKGGPVSADGYKWWNINYDTAPDGWSIEGTQWLILAESIAPPTGLHIVAP